MTIAFRKVWRDLWNHKGRTLLVVLSIAVGVMALGMTTASNTLLKRGLAASRLARHKPDARLSFVVPLNDDAVQAVINMPEVAEAEGRLSANIRWQAALDDEWKDGLLTVPPDYARQIFDLLELKSGAWPGADEIAVEVGHQVAYGVPPLGEMMYVQVNDRALPLKVVGALRDPLQLPPPYNAINKTAFYVNRDSAERILGTRDFNELRFTVPVYSTANVQNAAKAVQEKLKRMGIVSATTTFSLDVQDPASDTVQQFMDGLGLVLIVMAFFSLALSATLVINTINAIVAQQVTQIGIMKTIGGLTWQIVTLYLAGVAVYGLLSLALAVPIGAISGYYLSAFWLKAFNAPVAPFEILPESFWYQVGVGMIIPLAAALWPVAQGVSIPVRQAIAAYGLGTGRYGSKWLDRVVGRVQGLPRMAALALRNTFRRAGRVALTEITLLSAGSIFMMVVTTGNSFNQTIDSVWSNWGFDVVFIFKDYQRIAEMEPDILSQSGVRGVEMWAWVQAKAHQPGQADPGDQYDIQLRGIPHGTTMFNPSLTAGRLLNDADGHAVVFNQKLAGDMGLKVGDPVVVDLGGGKEATWTIVGLVSDIGVGGIQNTAFMWREVLNADMGQSGRATVTQIATTENTFEVQDSLKKRLQTYFESQNVEVVLAVGQIENKRMAGALWDLIGGLLQLMTVLVAVVGSIGLSGTLSINVMERRREIGVMRAVGASSNDVAAIFMGEGLLLGVLSWLLAVPLSMIGAQYFVRALGQALSFPFAYRYSYNGMWVWLVIILVLSVVASWLPARRATQISVRESLSYE